MSEPATPRVRRPSWRDPRLGVGVLLVAASVALGAWTVSSADDTVTAYTTVSVLSPGEHIDVNDLVATQVQVPAVAETYLTPSSEPATDLVVLRTVGVGELVPLEALGSAQSVQVRTVSLPVDVALAESIGPGAHVDLWVASPDPEGGPGALLAPEPLVQSVEVAQIHEDTSIFAGADQMIAQVLIPMEDLADVLAAQTGEGQITLVPVPA